MNSCADYYNHCSVRAIFLFSDICSHVFVVLFSVVLFSVVLFSVVLSLWCCLCGIIFCDVVICGIVFCFGGVCKVEQGIEIV